jgi:oligopeptide/dipeptide ABC transporter ATP-binding protein
MSVLEVRDLRIALEDGGAAIVEDVSLTLERGEVLGLVGESGSGKTTTSLALLGYTAPGVAITGGEVVLAGEPLLGHSTKEMRRRRGRMISYVPQDPSSALNPARRVGAAIEAMLAIHVRNGELGGRAARALEQVRLPTSDEFSRRFPHQLSGGQQQRVAIAVAIVCEPPIVVLDEPTTGLDVVTQAHIIQEVDRLRRERGIGLIYVSHDLSVVAQVADRIAVMYAGRVVEQGPTAEVLRHPRHPYTRGLISAVPDPRVARRLTGIPGIAAGVGDHPSGCAFAPRCTMRTPECEAGVPSLEAVAPRHEARCLHWQRTPPIELAVGHHRAEPTEAPILLALDGLCADYRSGRTTNRVVHDVTLHIRTGECLALIGESGSGKTTIARCVAGLHAPAAGTITFEGTPLAAAAAKRSRDARRRIQFVFQNPSDSLNPRLRIRDEITRPLRVLRGLSRRDAEGEVGELLARVRLPTRLADRFPSELSGGERQRVAIARALGAQPELLICDEITSSLDVSVQAAVLELLEELREQLGLAVLFITHDLGVVSSIADRGVVLRDGRVCETAGVRDLLDTPSEEYTAELLASVPTLAVGA